MKRSYFLPCLFILSVGCAAPQQEVQRRYFWPPLPNTPKIEFVAAYSSADDFPSTGKERLLGSVVGVAPSMGFKKPWGIASNGEGKVYIVDTNMRAVVVFDLKNHMVDIFNRDETSGLLAAPIGVAVNASGDIYISDPKRNKVYSFSKDGKPLVSIGDATTLNWPTGMAVDNALNRLYVVNGKSHNIAVFDFDGKHLFSFGGRGGGNGAFNYPTDVAIDSKGNIIVADSMNARIEIFDSSGKFIKKFGQRGDRAADFQAIKGIAVSRNDDIYVVDARSDRVLVFNENGEPLTSIGGTAALAETMTLSPGGFVLPMDIYIDKNDTMYVVDSMNKRFQVFQIINEEWLKEHPIE